MVEFDILSMQVKVLPQEVIQGARTWGWLGVDLVVSSVPANRVLSETQELLFVAQHATIVGVTDVIRVGQPLHVVPVLTLKTDLELLTKYF